ncbi:MAG: glycosyltransferase family 39 protein [Candidatus Cloacimonetes bacterium]|nr:glycosyltransferase family 39 protein [Candidatus Cloacimonadota bacterium]
MNKWLANNRRFVYTAILFFTLLFCLIFFRTYYQQELGGDLVDYWHHAGRIASSPGYLLHSPEFGQLEPLHNIIIGILRILPGDDRISLGIAQSLLFALVLILLYKMSLHFGGDVLALLVVCWTMTSYRFYSYIWNPARDIWVFYGIILLYYFSLRYFFNGRLRDHLIFCLCCGLLVLTDMRYIMHIALVALLYLFFTRNSLKAKIRDLLLLVFIPLLIITPWIIRQKSVFGEWMFISRFRMELFTKVFADREDYQHTLHYQAEQRTLEKSGQRLLDRVEEDSLTREVYDRLMSKDAYYKTHPLPGRLVRLGAFWKFCNFRHFLLPLSNRKSVSDPWSWQHNLEGIIHIGLLIPLFIAGVYFSFKLKKWYLVMFLVMLAGHTILHAFTYVQERYRLIIVPYYFLLAFWGLLQFIKRMEKKRT